MTRILVIARNTFREAVRDRIYLAVLVFAGVLLAATQILTPLALGEGGKITRDFGLSSLVILSLVVTVLVGTGLVHKEIERRTIMTLLSKPVGRGEFVLGKFLGLLWTLGVIFTGMLALLLVVLYVRDGRLDLPVLLASCLSLGELVVITGVAILFSTCTSPTLSGLLTLGTYVAGHFSADIKAFGMQAPGWIFKALASVFYYLVPNLELFNARGPAAHGIVPDPSRFLVGFLYATLYTGAVLSAAVLIFRRREFR